MFPPNRFSADWYFQAALMHTLRPAIWPRLLRFGW